MGRSKLKVALAHEKGVDFKKLREKKTHKERVHKKQKKAGANGGTAAIPENASDDENGWEDEDETEGGALIADEEAGDRSSDDDDNEDEAENPDLAALDESDDSDSSIEFEKKIVRTPKAKVTSIVATASKKAAEEDDEDDEEDEDDEDIPMSDLEEDMEDEEREELNALVRSRTTINNTTALLASLKRIALPTDKSVPFTAHQSIVSAEPTADGIEDVQDDLKRELAFYGQSLAAAKQARALLKSEGVPFSRPTDYFAEMVKDDGHMARVKEKLVEAASAKKASAEARKQRDLKKFGKQVQNAKLQERHKEKRETLDKIKTLKRKRHESGGGDLGEKEADIFDVAVDKELKSSGYKNGGGRGPPGGGANNKRQKKNEKYGFGGKKKHTKSGDAVSSGDMSGFSAKRMKTGAKPGKVAKTARLGKSRRQAGAGKR
ncbi:Uu.00g089990.m01.CDS01 [Anthostomella pinea]|uniref:Uu.00g089990.m01.CDS01 n=1 Tax=Anthostomella pinea TaxID=933095 RepID=A0AAI8VMX0_9PEZI|nr:Uu.00g089990.m01.CDS01 [Anthostomella pinea]